MFSKDRVQFTLPYHF